MHPSQPAGQPNSHSVIFDLGGVVLRWNPDDILQNYFADEISRSLVKREVFQHPDWLEMDRGVLSEDEAILRFHRRTGCSVTDLSGLMQAVKDSLQPIPGTLHILEELSQRGVPLYCLSNMPATTADYLRTRQHFWKMFRGVVISGEIHLLKPDRAIFEHIAARFGLRPASTIFIDDHLPNIEGARTLGFRTHQFANPTQCREALSSFLASR
jgi:putative hydrolase of the HAD superfamily